VEASHLTPQILFKLFWITDVYTALASCGAVYCNRSCL